MTKNEIIEAINATIIPNGQKGITAESLANLLIEMVNATPEGGSSSGSGQVVFYMGIPTNDDFTEFTLTQEQQAHNAEMFKIIKESPITPNASIDISDYMILSLTGTGIDASGYKQISLTYVLAYIPKPFAETEGLQDEYIGMETYMGSFRVFPNGTITLFDNGE